MWNCAVVIYLISSCSQWTLDVIQLTCFSQEPNWCLQMRKDTEMVTNLFEATESHKDGSKLWNQPCYPSKSKPFAASSAAFHESCLDSDYSQYCFGLFISMGKISSRLWFAPTASLAPGLSQPLLLRRTCETPCFFIFKRQHAWLFFFFSQSRLCPVFIEQKSSFILKLKWQLVPGK